MMDRERFDELPKMQLSFIDEICKPVYECLSGASAGLKPLLEGIIQTIN